MMRNFALIGLIPLLFATSPALSATKAQKMETCKFGAEHDNLTGAKRDAFIKRCMGNANYEPAVRKDAMKSAAPKKKPAAAKPEEKKQ